MIVILASRDDTMASTLRRCWPALDVKLLTPQDLSRRGWCYRPDEVCSSTVSIEGEVVGMREIHGVLTRLAGVPEQDLGHIVATDRTYVAAEMTAFLLAWLVSMPCPVLNRPTPACLSGPNWRPEQWTHAAARVGIPVSPVRRRECFGTSHVPAAPATHGATVTVVGQRCFGAGHETLGLQARRLAAAAGVELLAVDFSSPERGASFVGAHSFPDVTAKEVSQAVIDYFQEEVGHAQPAHHPGAPW